MTRCACEVFRALRSLSCLLHVHTASALPCWMPAHELPACCAPEDQRHASSKSGMHDALCICACSSIFGLPHVRTASTLPCLVASPCTRHLACKHRCLHAEVPALVAHLPPSCKQRPDEALLAAFAVAALLAAVHALDKLRMKLPSQPQLMLGFISKHACREPSWQPSR